jgi:hypothetical protein
VLRLLYKDPESAFCAFNNSDKSTITIDDILSKKLVLARLGYSSEELVAFLLRDRLF